MLEYLCNNTGLVLVCLPSGSTDVTTSPSRYMTQPSGIPILSRVLFMHVHDPYIPYFKIRRIFDLLVSPPFSVSLPSARLRSEGTVVGSVCVCVYVCTCVCVCQSVINISLFQCSFVSQTVRLT